MDYICNVSLPKKSCDVIYQYQYLMRSEMFVFERDLILQELIPLIRNLKESKFSMGNDDQLSFDTDKLGEISFSVKKNEKQLKSLQKYFETKES